ncbi:MAG: hypothetical protein [Treponematales bacterium]
MAKTKRQDWIPTQEDKLVDLMAVWQVKLADTSLQTAYGWAAADCTATLAALTAFLSAPIFAPLERLRVPSSRRKNAANLSAMCHFLQRG